MKPLLQVASAILLWGSAAWGHLEGGRVLVHVDPGAVGVGPSEPASLASLHAGLQLPEDATIEEDPYSRACRSLGRALSDGLSLDRYFVITLRDRSSVKSCLGRLQKHPWVRLAEEDGAGTGGGVTPTDPDFPLQWHHYNTAPATGVRADIHAREAWAFTTGSTGVVLAVLDTGLASNQTDFAGRTVAGYDFANDDADPADDHGHGTAVTGAACATGNNAHRVVGVDWHCRIMPIKVLDSDNFGYYSWWASGIDWAVAHGAKVINLSSGGSTTSFTLTAAINRAIAQGVIFASRTPFRVEAGLGVWAETPGTFSYEPTQTTWTASQTGTVFRVRVSE